MSLQSRKNMKTFTVEHLPVLCAPLKALVPGLEIEVDVASFNEPNANGGEFFDDLDHVLEGFRVCCFDRLARVLGELCEDDFFREEIQAQLKGIRIEGAPTGVFASAGLKEGVLHLEPKVVSNIGSYNTETEQAIREALNQGL